MNAQPSLFTSLQEIDPPPVVARAPKPPPGPVEPPGSLWFSAPQPLLPCPGNCAALRYVESQALSAARRTRTAGLRSEGGCSQCGGIALARVVRLSPLVLASRGGTPRKRVGQPWEEYSSWREGLLQERVIGVDWRRRYRFLPGWRAGRRR